MDHISDIGFWTTYLAICKPNTKTNDQERKKMKEVYL